jgi:hypothetical protein
MTIIIEFIYYRASEREMANYRKAQSEKYKEKKQKYIIISKS